MTPLIYKDLSIHFIYQKLSSTEAKNIKQFWLDSGAISDLNIIRERLSQVVLVVKNKENKIIGISSVYAGLLQDKPYFFYRMFIDPNYRNTRLMAVMTMQTWLDLSRRKNFSPIGMAIITENPKLQRSGFRKYFKRVLGFQYLGQNEIQQDIWFLNFNQTPIYFKT